MRLILKNLWVHRKQNGWIFAEIAVITALSWFMVDYLVVNAYDTYFCTPAGEFEKDHLCVGQFGVLRGEQESEGQDVTEEDMEGLYVLKQKLQDLPEVQSVCLAYDYLGANLRLYGWRTFSLADDTTKTIGVATQWYCQNECYFETQGLRAVEGSPDAETLSREIPQDGVIVTRSIAMMLFGTDQVVGKRLAMLDYAVSPEGRDIEVVGYHTIAGVVEDVKSDPNERYPYVVFMPQPSPSPRIDSKLLLRLKPDVDAEEFVKRLSPTLTKEFRAGISVLGSLETYGHHFQKQVESDETYMLNQLVAVPLVLFAINVVLGTLGTYWLQIRKRREDIGIMRAFGASRSRIFWTFLAEGAILTALATFVGNFIWFQFAASWDILSNGMTYGASGRETDWVTQFWPHLLIVSFVVFLLILGVVSLAIALPAWNVCRMRPVEALKGKRYE